MFKKKNDGGCTTETKAGHNISPEHIEVHELLWCCYKYADVWKSLYDKDVSIPTFLTLNDDDSLFFPMCQ